ncbi:MAG TPA: hypothetical protein VLM16_06175 [Ginsengibacter sp.]|nr:hypothetical protein [Ginsengibacter sp.]
MAYYLWTPALILFVFWLLYLATKNFLFSKALSWTHIILTLFSCLIIFIFPFLFKWFNQGLAGFPRHYYDTDQKVYEGYVFWTRKLAILGLILTVGQLTYLLNLIVGLTKRAHKTTANKWLGGKTGRRTSAEHL